MADSPKEGEAAQALFCAIADYFGSSKSDKELNLKKYPSYYVFKKAHEKDIQTCFDSIQTPTITLKQIEHFLESESGWYESSVNIAKTLLHEISTISSKFARIKAPKLTDIFYVRGAAKEKGRDANAMEHIAFIFDIANKNENNYFGDINKWSPADIYLVSKEGDKKILNEVSLATGKLNKSYNFDNLNKLVAELVDNGDLLPLSLKKAVHEAHIVKTNFVRSDEEKYFSNIKYYGVSDWSKKYTVAKPITRDIKIYFSKDKKEKIKIRHDAYSSNYGVNKAVKCEIEVTGAGGRGGSVVGIPLISNIINEVDSTFARELRTSFDNGIKKYSTELEKMNKKYNVKSGTKLQEPAKTMYDEDRATLSSLYVANAIMPVIYKWFKDNESSDAGQKLNDKLLQKFLEYTSSRTAKSGRFVIAK
jgi:hypothetical protein